MATPLHAHALDAALDLHVCELGALMEERDTLLPACPRRLHLDDRIEELRRKIDHNLSAGPLEEDDLDHHTGGIWGAAAGDHAGDLDDVA
jgi:hypothetical protein